MNQRAVIFDRDGVLTFFDVEKAVSFFQPLVPFSIFELGGRWQKWGQKVGFPSNLAEEKEFFHSFWKALKEECNLTEAQYLVLDGCNYTDYMGAYPDAVEILRTLRERNVAVGVLSNFSLASLDASLEAVGLRQWVDVACAAMVIGYAKPQAEAYLHVAKELGVAPQDCLFFDDEMPCVEGARAVGMEAYCVDRKLAASNPSTYVLHSLYGVYDLLF